MPAVQIRWLLVSNKRYRLHCRFQGGTDADAELFFEDNAFTQKYLGLINKDAVIKTGQACPIRRSELNNRKAGNPMGNGNESARLSGSVRYHAPSLGHGVHEQPVLLVPVPSRPPICFERRYHYLRERYFAPETGTTILFHMLFILQSLHPLSRNPEHL